jgi:hypothetical protein
MWKEPDTDDYGRMDMLLSTLAQPPVDELTLAAVPPHEKQRFIFVDGLNEVTSPVAADILRAMDSFAQRNPSAAVVVADRLARRSVPSDRWQLTTIADLDDEQIEAVLRERQLEVAAPRDVLRTAFFLNLVVTEQVKAQSVSQMFEAYFREHLSLGEKSTARLSQAAFYVYGTARSRTFDLADFSGRAGRDTTRALTEGGILLTSNGWGSFRHHLFHDYLASAWLVADPKRWGSDNFDAITFVASSFAALALGLEQIQEFDLAERFVQYLYDWNFYGAAFAAARGSSPTAPRVRPEMEVALMAMLAERRWDLILGTVQRASDALRLFRSEIGARFITASDLARVLATVRAVQTSSGRFEAWRELFLTQMGSPPPDEFVQSVESADPLLGWTAANVVKRNGLRSPQHDYLIELLSARRDVVRWRAVHALGAHPSAETIEKLFERLSDPYEWVRYGAIRSLVECAARESELRDEVMEGIRIRIDSVRQEPRTLWELENALVLRTPPAGWTDAVRVVIEQLWLSADTIEDQDRWRRLGFAVERQERERVS